MLFVWIAGYGLCCSLERWISVDWLPENWVAAACMIIYMITLLGWLYKTGNAKSLGLSRIAKWDIAAWVFWGAAVLLPIYNVLIFSVTTIDLPKMLYMLGVVLAEELLFRGFFVCKISQRYGTKSVIISAFIFSLMHIANIATGKSVEYTIIQVMCAFSAGLCYAAGTLWCRSIVPCIVIHFLTNITGTDAVNFPGVDFACAGMISCIVIQLICGFWLYLKIQKKESD